MPPSGTTGKSSSSKAKSSGPSRGPTDAPNRTAISKPASSGPSRGPTSAPNRTAPSKAAPSAPVGSGKKGSDMVGTPRGYVSKSAMQRVDREMTPILNAATTALSALPVGRAAGVLNEARVAGQAAVGRLAGLGKKAVDVERGAVEMAQTAKKLDAARKVEAAKLGKTLDTSKLPYRMPPRSPEQVRASQNVSLGQRALDKSKKVADAVASRIGLGKGPVARSKLYGVTGAGGEALMTAASPRIRSSFSGDSVPAKSDFREGAKSDFGGYRGGGPGSVSRTASSPRGPTGPKGQSRTSPASSGGRGVGASNRGVDRGIAGVPGGMNRLGGSLAKKVSSPRGPTGPKGEPRVNPVGVNTRTGLRGPTGPRGERRVTPQEGLKGFGERFGPLANEVIDIRGMQGPPNPPTPQDIVDAYGREYMDKIRQYEREMVSDIAGMKSKTGAQYGMNRARVQNDLNRAKEIGAKVDVVRNVNVDRSLDPTRETAAFRREISAMVPRTAIPSRAGLFDKMKGAYKSARKSFGDALYGEETPAKGDLFRRGGLVKKPKRAPPKKKR